MKKLLLLLLLAWPSLALATSYNINSVTILGTNAGNCTGTVTTVGTAVTGISGCAFVTGSTWVNAGIIINAVQYQIASVTNSALLTLSSTAGTQASPVAFTLVNSACVIAGACNGVVAQVNISTIGTGGTYTLGLGTNNSINAAKFVVTVTHNGYQSGANCGSATTYTQKIYGTHVIRQPYPFAAINDETTTFTTNIALGSATNPGWVFSGETVTAAIGAGFYTDGSANTNNSFSGSATNNSTLAYSTVRAIGNWTRTGWQNVTGATDTLAITAFSQFPMFGRPVSCVVGTIADAHSHSSTDTVSTPTIDPTQGDESPVQEYITHPSTSGFTQGDRLTRNFKIYPWIGDSTAVMDSSDAVYTLPTPYYAPQLNLVNTANTGSAYAYFDASQTYPGSHTSGTFVAGHLCTQSTSNATAYLIDVTGANGAGPIHLGAIRSGTANSTNGSTWTDSNGAVFTQTGAPTFMGVDSAACAGAESAFNPGALPPACRTAIGAAIKLAAYNNASSTPTHNDACGTVYSAAGYANYLGSTSAGGNTTANCWLTITPLPGLTQSQVVFQGVGIGSSTTVGTQGFGSRQTASLTNAGTGIHLKGLTVNTTGLSPVSVFTGETFLWLDNCYVNIPSATAWAYQITDAYITNGTTFGALAGQNGLRPFGGEPATFALIRGSDMAHVGESEVYTVVGNINSVSQTLTFLTEEVWPPANLMPIMAFNYFDKDQSTGNALFGFFASTSNIIGAAIVQNVAVNIYTNDNQGIFGISADSSTGTPNNNVMIWNNTIVGSRMNRSYNDTGTSTLLRQTWSLVGNLMDQRAIKSDTLVTANAARVGNWAELYATGDRSNLFAEVSTGSPGWAASGTFCNEFAGVNTVDGAGAGGQPPTCATTATVNLFSYKNRLAFDGTNGSTGGGDYHLLSNSPAINFFPAGTNNMPYDGSGQVRCNDGHGSAGFYEQCIGRTPVFGW